MSSEDIYDIDAPKECSQCPGCSAMNWVDGPHPVDMSVQPTEVAICWRCKKPFWVDEYHKEINGGDIYAARTGEGIPDPMIPVERFVGSTSRPR